MNQTFPSGSSMSVRPAFSIWDLVVIPMILVGLVLLTFSFEGAREPFNSQTPNLAVSLDPRDLPYYGLRSFFRMFVAVFCSLVFTFLYATLAAKNRNAQKILIPILDFLQSLPILGFLTATTSFFLGIFRGSMLGLEAASIFAIFTSQVWNMTFSFYHSLITVPKELQEASAQLRLSSWQKFWKLEVPFATPGLIWNTMMSVSGGWFFVVASEVISVVGRSKDQALPGLGSYISLAIERADMKAMVYAGLALFILILLYDQLFFRPIVAWAEKFKFEQSEGVSSSQSWMLGMLQRARFLNLVMSLLSHIWERLFLATARRGRPGIPLEWVSKENSRFVSRVWATATLLSCAGLLYILGNFMFGPSFGMRDWQLLSPNVNLNTELSPEVAKRFLAAGVPVGTDETVWLSSVCSVSQGGLQVSPMLTRVLEMPAVAAPLDLQASCARPLVSAGKVSFLEVGHVLFLGIFTAIRVVILIALAMLVWVPIGVWIGLRPRLAQFVQPFVQFLAAFPSNLIFPVAALLISRYHLNGNIFQSPLMILGTQWYILFNVIAGAVTIPNELKEAARVSGLRGWMWWKRLILPAIFPAFVTGGITASGGSWNASIVAEVVSWGNITLIATGLGAYIAHWSTGEFNPHVALGIVIMALFVLVFNRLIWRKLYILAERHYRFD